MYLFLALSLAMPFVMPSYLLTLYTELLILGLFAVSLNLQFGFAGLITFGHAAFYGLGAYTTAILLLNTDMHFLVAVLLGTLLSAVAAVPIGWLCTRAAGAAYAMLTLAVAQTFYAITFKWTELLGGSDGLAGVPRTTFGEWDAALATREGYFVVVVLVVGLAYAVIHYV
ncbi:MAG: branched-chain amino acid ABC transporter permease, partial [Alphaproteobacteria bacterium]|nr:branched-chain amino acid ABC transporter permease [Alphaproteobacteria bacterium]